MSTYVKVCSESHFDFSKKPLSVQAPFFCPNIHFEQGVKIIFSMSLDETKTKKNFAVFEETQYFGGIF